MGNRDDRLGSLLAFNDIALILSTYGVLLIFNYLFEPINSNTWIVCTFFVGIKILIVGIADITGIGRNYFVSLLFVLIADGIIILINQLMAFGLSLRLMLIMVVADLIFVFIAVFIWRKFSNDSVKNEEESDWIYSNEPVKTEETSKPKTETITTQEEVKQIEPSLEDVVIDDSISTEEPIEDVFDFQSLKNNQESDLLKENVGIFSEFKEEPFTQGQDLLNFEEITQELPSEEINKVLEEDSTQINKEVKEEPTLDSTFNYFEGLDIFNNFKENSSEESKSKTEVTDETNNQEEIDDISFETNPEPELETDENLNNIISEQPTESEIKEDSVEKVIEQENLSEDKSELSHSFSVSDEMDWSTESITSEIEEEAKAVEEKEPLRINSNYEFNLITNSTIGLKSFSMIPVNVNQEQLNKLKTEAKDEIIRFNQNLGKVIEEYNNALNSSDFKDKINGFISIEESLDLNDSEQILRDNLQIIDNKGFVSNQVMRSLTENVNKLNNRTYSLNLAEDNLKERLLREEQLLQERKRRQEQQRREEELKRKEQEDKLRREQLEKERQEQLEKQRKAQEELQKQTLEQTETIEESSNNEVVLQSDDMDIIIDAADLELLKEFLAQQESNA